MNSGSSTLLAPNLLATTPPKVRNALIHTTGFHVSKIGAGATVVAVLAMMDSAIVAALIAGGFTLVNTILTVWLTGLKRERRPPPARQRRRRRRGREPDPIDEDTTTDDS